MPFIGTVDQCVHPESTKGKEIAEHTLKIDIVFILMCNVNNYTYTKE